jgi:hypothetical protein
MRSDLASDWSNGLESDWPSRLHQCVSWCMTGRVSRIVSECGVTLRVTGQVCRLVALIEGCVNGWPTGRIVSY